MNVKIKEQDGNMVAFLEGILDTAAASETEKAMSPLNNVEGKDIILDCTQLEYISSAGLRVLLAAQKIMNKQGEMKVVHVGGPIMEIFEVTGFSDILTIEDPDAEA